MSGKAVATITLLAALSVSSSVLAQEMVPVVTLTDILDTVGEAAASASESTTINAISNPFTPSAAGLSYDAAVNTCGLSPWTRANAESLDLELGEITPSIQFASGIVGLDLACTNVGGNGVDLTGGIYAGGTRGVIDTPQYPGVDFNIDQWLIGAYGSFSYENFSANLKVQYDEADYIGTGYNTVDLLIADGVGLETQRTNVSGAASYAFEAMENVFLIPIVGFDVSHISADDIDFGLGYRFEPASGTTSTVFAGLTLAGTFVLSDQTSALVPFVSATYYHDMGGGLSGTIVAPDGTATLTFDGMGSYTELGAGVNYLKILDDGTGTSQLKQLTAGVRGYAKFNDDMTGYGAAATLRLQF